MTYKIPPINLWNIHAWSKLYISKPIIKNKSKRNDLLNNKIKEIYFLRNIN